MKTYVVEQRDDLKRDVKLSRDLKVSGYSKSQMKDMYPHGGYSVVGEASRIGNKTREKFAVLLYREHSHSLAESGAHGILYRRVSYAPVGTDTYVALLKTRKLWALIFALLVAALLIATLYLSLPPDAEGEDYYSPMPLPDSNAVALADAGDYDPDAIAESSGGSVALNYTLNAELSLSSGVVDMYFENPSRSNQNAVLSLYVVDAENSARQSKIAESGLIEAGNGLYRMTFDSSTVKLSAGAYNARYTLEFFDRATGEKALVEPTIEDVTLIVSE
jgi:hypothetical protein